jgi:hypothetical protein
MNYNFSINESCIINIHYVGVERQPVLTIDDFLKFPDHAIEYAASGVAFQKNPKDFYPGIRKPFATEYSSNLCRFLDKNIRDIFDIANGKHIDAVACVLSLATTAPQDLRPIQSVPHVDSCSQTNIASVHYLCPPHHGGTSFYRHRQTGYESLDETRLVDYAPKIKKEVMEAGATVINYMNGDNIFFERIAQVDAKFNRAIFYRSNILHSGNVQASNGLSENPREGRLTANTLIVAK